MSGLLDEFDLELLLVEESPVVTASPDEPDGTESNDNPLLIGAEPQDQSFDNANAITSKMSTSEIVGEEEGERTADAAAGYESHALVACSNDNPDWSNGTQPCPGASFHGQDGVFDGITDEPTSAPPSEEGEEDVVSNEFGGGAASNDDGNVVDGVSDGSTTSSLGEVPSTSPGEGPAGGPGDVKDGAGGNTGNEGEADGEGAAPPERDESEGVPDGVGASSSPAEEPSTPPGGPPTAPATAVARPEDDPETIGDGGGAATALPSFYSCGAASAEELVQSNGCDEGSTLRFDYEVYVAAGVGDAAAVLGAFERRLAEGVAASLGLAGCGPGPAPGAAGGGIDGPALELAVRNGGGGRRRRLVPFGGARRTLQGDRFGAKENRRLEGVDVAGLSTDPADVLDTELLNCTSSATLDTPSNCYPIIGAMTVWIAEAQQARRLRQLAGTNLDDDQEAMLLETVRSYIEQDQSSYVNDELLRVAYVGRRDPAGDQNPGGVTRIVDIEPGDAGGDGANPVLVGLAVAGALLAMMAFGAAYYLRRRRDREAESVLDLEQGAFPGMTPESGSNSNYVDDEDERSAPPQDENVPSDNLFGLTGVPSDAVAENRGREPGPRPSSLAAPGGASALVRQLSLSPPPGSPEGGDGQETPDLPLPDLPLPDATPDSRPLDATPDSQPLDNAPTIMETSDEVSVRSGAFDAFDEDDASSGSLTLPSENVEVDGDDPGLFDDTTLTDTTLTQSDDDDDRNAGIMV